MSVGYLHLIQLLQRTHRLLMEMVKIKLEELNIRDVNNVQSFILFNIGEAELTVGELTSRGAYLGSNTSYHVKKMVENGYLRQEQSLYDRRVSYVRLTEKGRQLREALVEVYQPRIEQLSQVGLSPEELQAASSILDLLDRFWVHVRGQGWRGY